MVRYTGPKNKLSRREGRDLFGTGGEALQRRLSQPPGVHGEQQRTIGRGRSRRVSEFTRQLREKQSVKRIYGMTERQFQRFYNLARRSQEQTGVALLKLLERRLDNVIYRLGLARTRAQARQFVNHGHVLVDGRRMDVPSYLMRTGQAVMLKPAAQGIPDVRELAAAHPPVPGWLAVREGGGVVAREPAREEIDPAIQEQLIVEFYSR